MMLGEKGQEQCLERGHMHQWCVLQEHIVCKAYDSARASDLNSSLPHPTAFNAHQQNAKVGDVL